MALENRGIPMITGLSIKSNVPVDDRFVYDITPDTIMLPTHRRYEGMIIYTKDDKRLKVLQSDLSTWSEIPFNKSGVMTFSNETEYTKSWEEKNDVYLANKDMYTPGTLVYLNDTKQLMVIADDMTLTYLVGGETEDPIDMTHKLNISRFERFLGTRRVVNELPGTYKILETDMPNTETCLKVVPDTEVDTTPKSVGITTVKQYNPDAIIGDRVEWILGTVPKADPTGYYKTIEDLQYDDKLHPRRLTMTEDCGGLLTGFTIDKDILIREALNAIMFPFHYPVMEASGEVGIFDITDDTKDAYRVTIKVTDMGDATEITSIQIFENGVQVLDGKTEAPRIDETNDTGSLKSYFVE